MSSKHNKLEIWKGCLENVFGSSQKNWSLDQEVSIPYREMTLSGPKSSSSVLEQNVFWTVQ